MVVPLSLFDEISLFDNLSSAQRALVGPLFTLLSEPRDTVVFEQGTPAEFLYVLVEGEALIEFKPYDGPEITVTRVKSEGIFGWSAMLGNPAYTSSAVCSTDCKLLQVSGADLRAFCEVHPRTGKLLLQRMTDVVAERLKNSYPQVMALLEQGLRLDNPQAM